MHLVFFILSISPDVCYEKPISDAFIFTLTNRILDMPVNTDPAINRHNYRIDYENALNDEQLQAVMFDRGPLLVIAGAGSGKTRTLTYRVARLVEEGISPNRLLLLTFTRKASAEMLNRASDLLDDRCEKVAGGTFHSFAHGVLRRFAPLLGFQSGFTIIDRADSESLIGMIKKDLKVEVKQGGFPRNQTLANLFSRAVNKCRTVEDVLLDDYPHFSQNLEAILTIFNTYQKRKTQHGFFDYDDLLVYLQRLLKDHSDLREKLSATYRYIMVDEYQDTNLIQADILYLLAGDNKNVMAVGDDSQSIYAFRGANFKNIMTFPQMFPGTEIIGLEENYRSVQPILSLTNAIIAGAAEKYEKNLFTRKIGGNRPLLVDTGAENRQSRFVVEKIKGLSREGVALKDIAVLFRAGFHSFDLEIELAREQVPFIKVGGFKFMESAHIKDLLAHLRVIHNPGDRISWYRLLLLLDQVGPKTAHSLFSAIVEEQAGYSAILTLKKTPKNTEAFRRLQALYAHIDSKPLSVAELGEAVLDYYLPILRNKYDDHPKRIRDLEQLLIIMQRYRELESFLIDMALEPPNASLGETLMSAPDGQDRLVLSTIHSAKGLEWHTVFIIWAVDGRFPSVHALDKREDLEEELRLMYVAATRARQHLYLTYPSQVYDRSSGLFFGRPSRFVEELPEEILERMYLADNGEW
jgi:DNA helicase-2/ATP-dependent DNA helicase PcrA